MNPERGGTPARGAHPPARRPNGPRSEGFRLSRGRVARPPLAAIAAWIGAVVVLMVTGHLAGTLQLPYGAPNVGPSGQAEQMISRDFPPHAVEDVLFESSSLRVGDLAYWAAIRDVLSRIQVTGRVIQIQSPLDPRFANQVSATRHAALVQFR
jgi:uncharacterized membrane protein YdfJ with MMPL/SSD domain